MNYHIGRIVLGSMCVGDSVWLGWSGIRVAGFSLQHGYHLRVRTRIKWHSHRVFKQWNAVPFSGGNTTTHQLHLRTFVVTVTVTLTVTYCFILHTKIPICRSIKSTDTAHIVTIVPLVCTTSSYRNGFNDH